MTLAPASRKRVGVVLLSAALLLAGGRVVSLTASNDLQADDLAPPPRRATVELPSAPRGQPLARSAPPVLRLDRLDVPRHAASGGEVDLFAAHRWTPSAKPASAPTAAPEPAPVDKPLPAFPYRYMGGMVDAGLRSAYLLKGDRVLVVQAGDVVDRTFRVDDIGGDRIALTFLPRNAPVSITLGAAR